MTMIAAVGDAERTILPDEGLENIGRQTIEGFYEAIGESKVLVSVFSQGRCGMRGCWDMRIG